MSTATYAADRAAAHTIKERPILFSGAMVRAILEGRKTQTRRVMKPQPDLSKMRFTGERWEMSLGYPLGRDVPLSPYGRPDDRLWVRETFLVQPFLWTDSHGPQPIHYAATTNRAEVEDYASKPSIHMPRWASRLTLEVTGVRVERLQDISEADALAEGVTPLRIAYWTGRMVGPNGRGGVVQKGADWDNPGDPPADLEHAWLDRYEDSARDTFRALWGSINAKRGYGWETNPWVWVVEFKAVPR